MSIKILKKDLKIKGRRIVLRPFKINDARAFYSIVKEKEIIKNTLVPCPVTLKKQKEFIKRAEKRLKKKEAIFWAIEDIKTKKLIGRIGLSSINWQHQNAGLHYLLDKNYRGQGIMTEAVKLVINFAFKKLKLHRLQTGVFLDNYASQKVLEKTGFKKEGLERELFFRRGRWQNDFLYGRLKKILTKKTSRI